MATVEELMLKLKCTRAEALEIQKADDAIDKGENLFPLTTDQEKASKKARAAGRAVGVYKFTQRERKADSDKRNLIQNFLNLLEHSEGVKDVEIISLEREILFTFNEKKYRITLSAPRK